MSDQAPIAPPPPPGPPRPRRHPVVSIIMVLVGLVLLLPGVCAIVFAGSLGGDGGAPLALLWLVCMAIGVGGLAMIINAFR
jgi:hypothetical protein